MLKQPRFLLLLTSIFLLPLLIGLWKLRETGSPPSPNRVLAPANPASIAAPQMGEGLLRTGNRAVFVPGELIVKFKPEVNETVAAEVAEASGAQVKKRLLLDGYYLFTVPYDRDITSVASTLRGEAGVQIVEQNAYAYAHFVPNDPLYQRQWNFPQIQMPKAWDISRGDGVVVAVVDTGVAYEDYEGYRRAPDLASTLFVPGYDFVNDDTHPNDDNSHGTHVTGTIAESTNNNLGAAGIANGARIMPVKVLDGFGTGTYAAVADGITWATNNGAKVINMSLGGLYTSTLLEDAVNYAYNHGVVLVASMGNDSSTFPAYPAGYDNVIRVGAVRYDETLTFYSNYGQAQELVAPGGDTLVDQNGDGYGDGVLQQTFAEDDPTSFGYYYFMGTSMAAPHVSGVAALLISSGVATTPDQVRRALRATAKDLGAEGWDQVYGYGLLQANDALHWAPTPVPGLTPRAYLPHVSREANGGW